MSDLVLALSIILIGVLTIGFLFLFLPIYLDKKKKQHQ